MWQYIVVGIAVALSAIYVARTLGPRSWRFRRRGAGQESGGDGCGNCSPSQKKNAHSAH